MSILKGASAAALYGSQAANGVILITTKKGKAGMQRIVFNSNLTVDHAICLPEFQDRYGASGATSWGAEDKNLKAYNNVDDYFSNGVTATNSLSIMTGKEKMQTYFSYANTTAKGIVDVNKLQKHNITFRETASLFNDRLTLDANVNLMTQKIKNRPTSGGYYMNPLVGLYTSRAAKTSVPIVTTTDSKNMMKTEPCPCKTGIRTSTGSTRTLLADQQGYQQ